MTFDIDLKFWLQLSVVGTVIATLGALLGIFIKEYFLQRSFEQWKQKKALEQLYQKFRDPLLLSAKELASRVSEVLKHYPTVYLKEKVLTSRPEKQLVNSINDAYFQRYKLMSTVYRFAAFLAWLELYRQELTFMHPERNEKAEKLESVVELLRGDLADGQLNQAKDWEKWRDTLIFREELRAIGEVLIVVHGTSRTVMGYGTYCENIESSNRNAIKRWMPVILNFLMELENNGKDFREVRLKLFFVHLIEFIKLLDNCGVERRLLDAYDKITEEMKL
ncbi:hypothetical protein [Undibacterium pigrum]|uniref:Uncharacterized protein n=1 Tax=Undibacterium pigrum TaxID=401470 RepID=A0A318IY36_9BURK|nr:hypothetical protein [Undibacterium pigrum]PXX40225.1 hypothetical protein DFR42_10858 [Undibacterium pigrum]